MTPNLTINLLRVLFVVFTLSVGSAIGTLFDDPLKGSVVGIVFGLAVVLADRLLRGISLRVFSSATLGLLLGFLFAQLLLKSDILRYIDEATRWMISLCVYATCGYIGMMLAIRSNRDELALIIPYVRFQQSGSEGSPVLADTNVIIDGRISDVCSAGFLSGSLVVPRFILDELQSLADSNDPKKREAGKRGLDTLNRLQAGGHITITIHEAGGTAEHEPVDTRLVRLAQALRARLLTNDANLAKVAGLHSVRVLNLGELARAMRPVVATGDTVDVSLQKEGREPHQAVGYLPDGSMIVVNQARQLIGKTVAVTVSGTVYTSAGRMLFGEISAERFKA